MNDRFDIGVVISFYSGTYIVKTDGSEVKVWDIVEIGRCISRELLLVKQPWLFRAEFSQKVLEPLTTEQQIRFVKEQANLYGATINVWKASW